MLEDNIEVTGWRAQWLERKLPALQWYVVPVKTQPDAGVLQRPLALR